MQSSSDKNLLQSTSETSSKLIYFKTFILWIYGALDEIKKEKYTLSNMRSIYKIFLFS